MRPRILILALLMALVPAAAAATPPGGRGVAIPKIPAPHSLEALLAGPAPAGFVRVGGFVQHDPREGLPSSQPTAAFLAYDERDFYVVFYCRDSDPKEIRAQLSQRDNVLNDDYVGVILDPDHARRQATIFIVDAGGQQQDGLIDQGMIDAQPNVTYDLQAADYTYDTNWRSAARRVPDGYRVALAIPFTSLRFPRRTAQDWGVLLFRYIYRDGELSYWPSVTRKINGLLPQEGTAAGLEGIEAPHNLELIPYGVFRANHSLDPDTGEFQGHALQQRYGLDAKYTFLTDMNLDLTLNPDFSEVESDAPLPTTNQRFEVVYPEKRPFFEERSDIFNIPENELFFSRRIEDPEYGARLTGKQGRTTLGALFTDDRGPGELVAPGDPRYGQRAEFGAVRLMRDLFSDSTVGALWTSRSFLNRRNDVFEADANLRLSSSLRFTASALESATSGHSLAAEQDPAATPALAAAAPTQTAGGGYAALNYLSKGWQADVNYNNLSPNFQDDLGYIPRTDIRDWHADALRNFYGKGWYRLLQPQVHLRWNKDHEGNLQDEEFLPQLYIMFPRNADFEVFYQAQFERYLGAPFYHHLYGLGYDLPWGTRFKLSGGNEFGDAINYFPAAGMLPFLGNFQLGEYSLDFRPTRLLDATTTFYQTRMQANGRDGPLALASPGRDLFNENILRSEWVYQFSRALSYRFILTYQNSLPNAQLTASPYTKQLDFDGLVTYLVTPGTAVYAGYDSLSDNYLRPLAFDPAGALLRGPAFLNDGRVIFVKISYLFRY